jgi:hypothetical protein
MLPFNLMLIWIGILPIAFSQIWTLQCSKMTLYSTLRLFHFYADPDPAFHFDADPAIHFHAGPDPASHTDADPDPQLRWERSQIGPGESLVFFNY